MKMSSNFPDCYGKLKLAKNCLNRRFTRTVFARFLLAASDEAICFNLIPPSETKKQVSPGKSALLLNRRREHFSRSPSLFGNKKTAESGFLG
jgi:hypothetical protein